MKPLFQTTQFSKDLKRLLKRGKEIEKLQEVVRRLAAGDPWSLGIGIIPSRGSGRGAGTVMWSPIGC